MVTYLYSVLLLLLILICFTALLYVLTQFLNFAFLIWIYYSVQYLEQINGQIILYIVLFETRSFFVTSDVALISAIETILFNEKFF